MLASTWGGFAASASTLDGFAASAPSPHCALCPVPSSLLRAPMSPSGPCVLHHASSDGSIPPLGYLSPLPFGSSPLLSPSFPCTSRRAAELPFSARCVAYSSSRRSGSATATPTTSSRASMPKEATPGRIEVWFTKEPEIGFLLPLRPTHRPLSPLELRCTPIQLLASEAPQGRPEDTPSSAGLPHPLSRTPHASSTAPPLAHAAGPPQPSSARMVCSLRPLSLPSSPCARPLHLGATTSPVPPRSRMRPRHRCRHWSPCCRACPSPESPPPSMGPPPSGDPFLPLRQPPLAAARRHRQKPVRPSLPLSTLFAFRTGTWARASRPTWTLTRRNRAT